MQAVQPWRILAVRARADPLVLLLCSARRAGDSEAVTSGVAPGRWARAALQRPGGYEQYP